MSYAITTGVGPEEIAMTTAKYEACVGGLHESYFLVRRIFLMFKVSVFFASEEDSSPIYRVYPKR